MEQAKRMDTESLSRLVRVRLLENIASPEGPSGYVGDVLTLLEEAALRLIEAGVAIELADPAPAVETRVDGGDGAGESDAEAQGRAGAQRKAAAETSTKRSQAPKKVSGEA